MRILIFHGYLLEGTGSNVYNARLAAALVGLGHEVHLLCQDRRPERQPFVDAVGDWEQGSLRVRELRGDVRCTVYRPDIGGLLPVYVADGYDGIQARTFARVQRRRRSIATSPPTSPPCARSPRACAPRSRSPTT